MGGAQSTALIPVPAGSRIKAYYFHISRLDRVSEREQYYEFPGKS